MAEEQKQTVFEPAKVIAVGIAAPLASLLTSRFGIAGTMLGLAISSVILTVLVDALKVYLARASTKVAKVPSGLRTVSYRRGIRGGSRALLSRVLSFPTRPLSPKRRRSVLVGSLLAAGISFLVGAMVITGVEASVGRSLSCWLWSECPAEKSSADGAEESSTGTLPSIFGGSPSASGSAPAVRPVDPEQQPTPPGSPGAPSVDPSVNPSAATGTERQDSGAPDQGPDQSSLREEGQQQSRPYYSDEVQQQGSSNATEEAPQKVPQGEDRNGDSGSSGRYTREPEQPYGVPWTT